MPNIIRRWTDEVGCEDLKSAELYFGKYHQRNLANKKGHAALLWVCL